MGAHSCRQARIVRGLRAGRHAWAMYAVHDARRHLPGLCSGLHNGTAPPCAAARRLTGGRNMPKAASRSACPASRRCMRWMTAAWSSAPSRYSRITARNLQGEGGGV